MIVDDEAGSGFAGEPALDQAFLQHDARLGVLFAVLEYLHACGKQGAGLFFHAAPQGKAGIGEGVEIGFSGEYSGHGCFLLQ